MINNSWSLSDQKTEKFGKYFKSIDFDVLSSPYKAENTVIGNLIVGNSKYTITYNDYQTKNYYTQITQQLTNAEKNYVEDTIQRGFEVFCKKIKFNR